MDEEIKDAEGERIAEIKDAEGERIAGIIEGTNEWELFKLRNTRNAYLQLTDKYLLPDYPITPENLEIIKAYRQYLRNYINENKGGILNGVIPEILPIPF